MRLENYKSNKAEYSKPPFSVQPHPWLVICHGNDFQKQTFFSISENHYYVKTIPDLRNNLILAYDHEWLVLLNYDSKEYYVWNPISMDKIHLPPLPDTEDYMMECLLSAPPHDPQCHVLFLHRDVELSLYLCKPGYDQQFHRQDLQFIGDHEFRCWTVFKGKFYALTLQRSLLIILDLDHDSRIQVTRLTDQPVHDSREFLDMPHSKSYLIQSCYNDLLYIKVLYFGMRMSEVYGFLVFQFDFVEKKWVKVKRIGEMAIFLGSCWGTSCSTKGTNLKRESIYFIRGEDHRLYVFNLKTQSISVSIPYPYVSKKQAWFCWLPHKGN